MITPKLIWIALPTITKRRWYDYLDRDNNPTRVILFPITHRPHGIHSYKNVRCSLLYIFLDNIFYWNDSRNEPIDKTIWMDIGYSLHPIDIEVKVLTKYKHLIK